MNEENVNEALMLAVTFHKVKEVEELLAKGADPNYRRFPDETDTSGVLQPTTPLRMVIFRISDVLLNDNDLDEFAVIAKMLLQFGADPAEALRMAEERYGKYDPLHEKTPFMNVWSALIEGR